MATKSRVTVLKADITPPKRLHKVSKSLSEAAKQKVVAHTAPVQTAIVKHTEAFVDKNVPEKHRASWRAFHRHPVGWPAALFVLLALCGAAWAFFATRHHIGAFNTEARTHIVIVSYDGQKHTLPTDAKNVGELLSKLRTKINPGDRVEPAKEESIVQDNFLVNIYRAEPITIVDGGAVTTTISSGATARSAVASSGVTVYPEDEITSGLPDNMLLSGSVGNYYTITRAIPIDLSLYGAPAGVRTRATTVGKLLAEKKIKLGKDDFVKPAANTPLSAGLKVEVNRNGIHVITVTEEVIAPIETVVDTSLSLGATAVRQEGSPGKQVRTYEVNVQGGVEVSRKLLQAVTTVEPVKRVVARGSTSNVPANKQAVLAAAGINPGDYGYVDYIFSHESGWNAAAASRNGYYGLGQTNLAKLSGACPNWQSDPVCQTRLFTGYAGRYGGWAGAYNFWVSHHWW